MRKQRNIKGEVHAHTQSRNHVNVKWRKKRNSKLENNQYKDPIIT